MNYKRILLVRTDRIGDVLLTTPAIEALRRSFPYAHIAMMVSPYARYIVEDNPYLDEVIIYDKDNEHKSITAGYVFSKRLKKKGFDLAVIFHPTNRAHIITYLAKIPKRIGYDRNFSFLLTDKIPHTKQLGRMHEIDYTLQMLEYLGIKGLQQKSLYMPIKSQSEQAIISLFIANNINPDDKIVVIHPGASCVSKIWPAERFAEAADRLIDNFKAKIVIVGGQDKRDLKSACLMMNTMLYKATSFAARLNVSELASCIKKAKVFISNDSGPVHIACALGIPSVVIFGRAQAGLSPARWGPTGKDDTVIHKDVGCGDSCLAHNCEKGFACLMAVTVDEVYEAAAKFLV